MEMTDRLRLPLLVPGQAQKEVTHNEALLLVDGLLHPLVEGVDFSEPPASRQVGQVWIVASGGAGEWADRDGCLAFWTSAGWRFIEPVEGMSCWLGNEGRRVRYRAPNWVPELAFEGRPSLSPPAGGAVVDVEAREVLSALIAWFRNLHLLG